ncbi:MAG TPA: hypothetical protein VHC22_18295 [Pirellulales bacterium]|nr:hypothetical protein [Pirellulales bacterium]
MASPFGVTDTGDADPAGNGAPAPASLAPEPQDLSAGNVWQRLDDALVWVGDRLNPILVKETRQALKSRQFIVTFTLVLALAWVWSIFGVAVIGPSIYIAARGLDMFLGYYVILAVPLLVVVPFGAFRSLASEREDGTYELLSITTLRPRQIVSGKLGSAILQMLVYLSAVAPCLAFTYMLRGIDAPTILYVICCFFFGSLGASVLGLLVATLTNDKHWQIVLSVLFLFGLAMLLWFGLMMGFAVLAEMGPPFQDQMFWIVNAVIFTAYASYFALSFCAASAQLTFASDNRSTKLRMVMVGQQALLVGWFGWYMFQDDVEPDVLLVYFAIAAIHWSVMGMFINAEFGELSLRVKRQLPQSFLGRLFLTWFNPGPATGYMFVVANLLSVLVVAGGFLIYNSVFSKVGVRTPRSVLFAFGALTCSYIVVYLGVGRLLITLLRRVSHVSLVLAVLLQALLVLAGCGIPLSIHLMTPEIRRDYSLIEISNPFYSLVEVLDERGFGFEVNVLLTVVPVAAGFVFLLNLPGVVSAVNQVRIAQPKRVREEDAELEAQRAPPPGPTSPFDE